MNEYPDIIPYDVWINSQLSVVRFSGSCLLDGDRYELDFDSCTKEIVDGEELYKPDLVRVKK